MGELNKYFEKLFNAIDKSHLIPLERKSILYELRELEEAQSSLMVPTKNHPQLTEEKIENPLIISKTLALFSSMIYSGEKHTPKTEALREEAFKTMQRIIKQLQALSTQPEEKEWCNTDLFRPILYQIKTIIDNEVTIHISDMKSLWNDLSNAITQADTQPEADKDGWVSVSKKLPERVSSEGMSGDCLVTNGFWYNIMQYNHYHKNWEDYTENIMESDRVTHWQLLPSPPVKKVL